MLWTGVVSNLVRVGPSTAPLGPIGLAIDVGVAVFTILRGIFGSRGPEAATKQDVQNVANQLSGAVDGVKRLAWFGLRSIASVLNAVAGIFNTILGPLHNLVSKLAALLKHLYTKVILPLLKALAHLRKLLDDIYRKYLRPVLNAIQRIRRVLAILRIFHVKWAGALDDKLARIEGKIIGPYLWVLRQLNGYGSWLNVILTAKATIQRAVFVNSMYAYQRDWVNMFWTGQTASPSTGGAPAPLMRQGPPTLAEVRGTFTTYTLTGGGPVAEDMAAARAAALSVA